jgi:NAD(P)-dependent dehydrogenase (short-subunit alcohol dehydrogenase family)
MRDFEGRVAIITGSTRGIGYATARMIAARGGKVTISSRKPEACERVGAAMIAEGHDVLVQPANMGAAADVEALYARTLEKFGRIDIVIANAATNPVFDALVDLPEDIWSRILETNLTGPWRLARRALPHMAEAGGGAIVFVSSIGGRIGARGNGAYGISKAALEQMTRQLAFEWGPKGVRVNTVAPGTTRTDMIRALTANPDYERVAIEKTMLKRLGEAEDVAAAIAFMASPAARHITGQLLTVDGGQTMMLSQA